MQGKSRTVKTADTSYIFYKIRESRCPKTRRSWQRRARIALELREDLTPAERHEICCVWSKSNVGQIDSPAMSKYFKQEHKAQPHRTISAKSCTRRSFEGRKKSPEKPSLFAANDPVFESPKPLNCDDNNAFRTSQTVDSNRLNPVDCTYQHAAFLFARLHSQECFSPHFRHGSVLHGLFCGNHTYPNRPRVPMQRLKKRQRRKQTKVYSR
jgi:hypothetical protein